MENSDHSDYSFVADEEMPAMPGTSEVSDDLPAEEGELSDEIPEGSEEDAEAAEE